MTVDRGGCYFTDKIRHAQAAGAAGVIVANNDITGFFKSKDNGTTGYWLLFLWLWLRFRVLFYANVIFDDVYFSCVFSANKSRPNHDVHSSARRRV